MNLNLLQVDIVHAACTVKQMLKHAAATQHGTGCTFFDSVHCDVGLYRSSRSCTTLITTQGNRGNKALANALLLLQGNGDAAIDN
jgi:hypothetical protein